MRDSRRIKADIPAGHEDPLSYAISERDRSTLEMVNQAVRHKQVLLAYQAVVPGPQSDPSGLLRRPDKGAG